MGKYTGKKAWLSVLSVNQDGKPIEGEPKAGAYTIAMKPGQKFYGDPDQFLIQLGTAFPGCSFTWEG